MQSPTVHYISDLLSYWTLCYTNIKKVLSPNMASIIGLTFAFISARMVMADKLVVRKIGSLIFCIQFYFDSLDGDIASAKHDETNIEVSNGKNFKLHL